MRPCNAEWTPEVEKAFAELKKEYAGMVREANPLYASQK